MRWPCAIAEFLRGKVRLNGARRESRATPKSAFPSHHVDIRRAVTIPQQPFERDARVHRADQTRSKVREATSAVVIRWAACQPLEHRLSGIGTTAYAGLAAAIIPIDVYAVQGDLCVNMTISISGGHKARVSSYAPVVSRLSAGHRVWLNFCNFCNLCNGEFARRVQPLSDSTRNIQKKFCRESRLPFHEFQQRGAIKKEHIQIRGCN